MVQSNKRRKLDIPPGSPQLSAVAARRALQGKAQAQAPTKQISDVHVDAQTSVSILGADASEDVDPAPHEFSEHDVTDEVRYTEDHVIINTAKELQFDEEGTSSSPSPESCPESPIAPIERPSIALSTFNPTQSKLQELKDGTLSLRLAPGERLVILGQYELSVQSGQVTLLGATLQASEELYRVYAPSSHALPVIRCLGTDINEAEICLHQCESGLESLKSLSPLFGRLWNNGSGPLCARFGPLLRKNRKSTYKIAFSEDEPYKAYLQPLISLPEWNRLLAKLTAPETQRASTTMVCGPKSSGKSTFARLLANRLLSVSMCTTADTKSPGIVLIDLDPGQPEYSPPGQVSLIHIQRPVFGPPYTHPTTNYGSRILRSHAIAALTPSTDPSLYMACALDLFSHYRNLFPSSPQWPLIINTPGWVLGTGLEILMELVTKVRPSSVVYMSDEGPHEVVQSLKSVAKLSSAPLYTLPSQLSEYTTRTSAHLRTMQAMSYFHLDITPKERLSWNCTPLTSNPPWEIGYAANNIGIIGILCYGEQPPPNLLADTINGSLVAVVVIDDTSAIPGWDSLRQDQSTDNKNFSYLDQDDICLGENVEIRAFDTDPTHQWAITQPLIVRTPVEDLPYFNPANTISLDPQFSHTIGLALIRGIDIPRRRLQILTPIPKQDIMNIHGAGKQVVLVSGKLDTPGWAYTEELYQRGFEKARNKADEESVDDDIDDGNADDLVDDSMVPDAGFENVPWVERLKGSQGRGFGARVWRVRRDLGKMTDGGA